MNVFCDYHHGDLYYSLHRLFTERLGWTLYRPIGLDWFNEGYWKIAEPYNNAMDTIKQYLDINNNGWDQFKNLNGNNYHEDDTYFVFDESHSYYHKAITLKKFKDMKFDIIISSVPSHDISFARLIEKYQPQAKHIAQMGNWMQITQIKNVMHSCPYIKKPEQNAIYYHQEVDPHIFKYVPPNPETKKIFSLVNTLPFRNIYEAHKAALLDIEFRAYGIFCPEGVLSGPKGIAPKLQEANLGWNIKPFDGFSHTAMAWYASGRACITRMSEVMQHGWDGPALFEPKVTCIALTESIEENCKNIRTALQPENNLRLCENALARFNNIVNYEEEAKHLKHFLETLI